MEKNINNDFILNDILKEIDSKIDCCRKDMVHARFTKDDAYFDYCKHICDCYLDCYCIVASRLNYDKE